MDTRHRETLVDRYLLDSNRILERALAETTTVGGEAARQREFLLPAGARVRTPYNIIITLLLQKFNNCARHARSQTTDITTDHHHHHHDREGSLLAAGAASCRGTYASALLSSASTSTTHVEIEEQSSILLGNDARESGE